MAAAEITEKTFPVQGSIRVVGRFDKATQNDWIVLPYPGVSGFKAALYTGADEGTLTFGTALVDNKGTAYGATDTTIHVDTAKITRLPPYYVQTSSGEIMMVIADGDTDGAECDLTVIRGCLGTIASATGVADDNTLYIKNIIIFGAATTGFVDFEFAPLPMEPKARLYE